MVIKPNASLDEKTSPFYIENEKRCIEFEKFIAKHNGLVKGSYNAWSYHIIGKITHKYDWTLEYKKATYSSGHILFSSEYQNLFVGVKWIAKNFNYNNPSFCVSKKTFSHSLKMLFNNNLNNFQLLDKYVIKSQEPNSKLVSVLFKILRPLFLKQEIYYIEYSNNELKVDLRTENNYYDIFDELLDI